MNIENNLFYYATKELSQDAFICWLCSYALAGSDPNDALRECALEMIKVFMEDNKSPDSINKSDILLESIEKQVGNIDVLLTVRYRGDLYKIIIEDKVYSAEHDNQLERYVSQTNDKDSSVKVIGVYFKTGFQSDYSNVIKADYRIINRLQIIKILEPYVDDSKSEVLADYYNYWSQFDEISKRYRVAPLSEWDWRGVNGFYENLKEVIHEYNAEYWSGFGYVPNPSGGFWGLWYGPNSDRVVYNDEEFVLYLQTEIPWNSTTNQYDYKICLKLEVDKNNNTKEQAVEFRDRIIELSREYGFERPNKIRYGGHMTICILKSSLMANTNDEMIKCTKESMDCFESIIKIAREDSFMK